MPDRQQQKLRHVLFEDPKDVCQVQPKQLVKDVLVIRLKIIAVPPKPVTAFGCIQLLPSLLDGRCMLLLLFALQESSCPFQALPGVIVLRMTNPDPKVSVYPGPGMDSIQPGPGRMFRQLMLWCYAVKPNLARFIGD